MSNDPLAKIKVLLAAYAKDHGTTIPGPKLQEIFDNNGIKRRQRHEYNLHCKSCYLLLTLERLRGCVLFFN